MIRKSAWCPALDKMEFGASNIWMPLYRRVPHTACPQASIASQLVTGRYQRSRNAPVGVTMWQGGVAQCEAAPWRWDYS
jgi:hypothetical protein